MCVCPCLHQPFGAADGTVLDETGGLTPSSSDSDVAPSVALSVEPVELCAVVRRDPSLRDWMCGVPQHRCVSQYESVGQELACEHSRTRCAVLSLSESAFVKFVNECMCVRV